jgi:hypothetical protein
MGRAPGVRGRASECLRRSCAPGDRRQDALASIQPDRGGQSRAPGRPHPNGPGHPCGGSTTTYDLSFQATQLFFGPPPRIILASTYEQPTPGNWELRMDLEDVAGAQYEATTKAVVGASP